MFWKSKIYPEKTKVIISKIFIMKGIGVASGAAMDKVGAGIPIGVLALDWQ